MGEARLEYVNMVIGAFLLVDAGSKAQLIYISERFRKARGLIIICVIKSARRHE